MRSTLISAAMTCAAALPALADAPDTQPVLSERYEVSDARAAMDEVMARWDTAQAEQQARFMAHEGDLSDFVRSDPIFQDVTWPYGQCTDLVSLFPPPMENWAIRTEFAGRENPIGADRAELFYVSYDPTLASDAPDFTTSQATVTVRISTGTDISDMMAQRMADPMMRDIAFEPGPFGYPVVRFSPMTTVVGPHYVDVSGTGDSAVPYFEAIVACAIDSGLIADGVDPSTLTR